MYTYSGVNCHLNALLTGRINDTKSRLTNGKTDFNSGFKSWFIYDMGYEKTISRPFANLAILYYEHSRDSKNAGSKSNLLAPAAKRVDTPSAEKFGTSQNTDSSPLLQTRISRMTLVNPATLKCLRMAFNLKVSQVENEKSFSDKKAIDKVSTFESTTPLTIESLMFQRTRNKQNLQHGYFFNFDIKPTGRNLVSAFQNRGTPRGSSDPSSDSVILYPRPDSKYVHRFVKNNRLQETDEDTVSDSRELVPRKTSPQKIKTIPENRREIQTEEISSGRMYGDLTKEPGKEKQTPEIDIIADKVYKIIERRIFIEKDRRGLF